MARETSQDVVRNIKELESHVASLQENLKIEIQEKVQQALEPRIRWIEGKEVDLSVVNYDVERDFGKIHVVETSIAEVSAKISEDVKAVIELRKKVEEVDADSKLSYERMRQGVIGDLNLESARTDHLANRVARLEQALGSERSSEDGVLALDEPAGARPPIALGPPGPPSLVSRDEVNRVLDYGAPPETAFKPPSIKSSLPTGNEVKTQRLAHIVGSAGTFLTQAPLTPEDGGRSRQVRMAEPEPGPPDPGRARAAPYPPGLVLDARAGIDPRRAMHASGAGVVVNITPIPHNSKLREVNLRSLKNLLDKVYAEYQRVSIDATYTLVDFISEGVLKLLVADMRRKGHALADKVNMRNIYRVANDELITDMLMEYVRPKYKGEYEFMMYAAVTRFPKGRSANFVTADYDQAVAMYVDDIVADVLLYHGYMTHKISEDQKLLLPGMKWGESDGERSLIQIAMQCLEPYSKQFKSIISSSKERHKLKEIGKLEAWAAVVLEVNDQYANLAIAVRNRDLQAQPVEKAEVIQSKSRDLQMQKSFINGKGEKRELDGRRCEPEGRRGEGEGDLHRLEHEYGYDGGDMHGWGGQLRATAGGGGVQGPSAQLKALDWENPRHPEKGPQPVRGPQRAPGRGAGGAGRAPDIRLGSGVRGGYGPTPPKGPPPKEFVREFSPHLPLVCYKFAVGTCDEGDNCQYSHNIDEARR